jgi:hypothetical protein
MTAKEKRKGMQAALLAAFVHTGTITEAAAIAKVGEATHYDWIAGDPEYAVAFATAKRRFIDSLRYEATIRARDGLRIYKFYKGKPIKHPVTKEPYYELAKSDQMLLTQLKAYCPEDYSDKHVVKHEGPEEEFDYDAIPIGPGEPEEAFADFLEKLKKIGVDRVKMRQVTTLSIQQRAEEIKRQAGNGNLRSQ